MLARPVCARTQRVAEAAALGDEALEAELWGEEWQPMGAADAAGLAFARRAGDLQELRSSIEQTWGMALPSLVRDLRELLGKSNGTKHFWDKEASWATTGSAWRAST